MIFFIFLFPTLRNEDKSKVDNLFYFFLFHTESRFCKHFLHCGANLH